MCSAPSSRAHDPLPNLDKPNLKESDKFFSAVDMPPDPLLESGSFIDADPPATSGCNNNTSTAGVESVTTPQATPTRRPSAAESWLPSGWEIEDRVRTSGATAGTVDKYYFHVASGRRFRSKKEVLYFLETGSKRKKKIENSDVDADSLGSARSTKQKCSTKSKTYSPLNFDYFNPPESVEWALTDAREDSWTPSIAKVQLSESVKQDWAVAFTYLTTSNGGRNLS